MADVNLGTYSPEDMIAVITTTNMVHYISGFSEGTMVSAEKSTPSSTLVLNGDKGGGRVFRSTSDGMITFTLNQWSASNDVLTLIHNNDAQTRDNTWLFNLTLIDGTGRSGFNARQCFIENFPVAGFGTDIETRSWTVKAVDMDFFIGGNAKIPADVIANIESLGGVVSARWR